MILQSIGAPGLAGFDKMLSHLVAVEITKVIKFIDKGIKNKTWSNLLKDCENFSQNIDNLRSRNFFVKVQ